MKLHQTIIGKGPTLVLLHGWGFNCKIWSPLIPLLKEKYTLHLLDLPGFGNSVELPNPYTLPQTAEVILENTPPEAIYCGWSMGGLISIYIAIHHSHRVHQLITVSASPCFIQKTDWPGVPVEMLEKFSEELIEDYKKTIKQFILLQFYQTETPKAEIRQLIDSVLNAPIPPKKALLGGLSILKESDLRADLNKISCPQNYIFGKLDRLAPATTEKPLRKLLPQADISVIDGTSHAPFLSNPREFLKVTGLTDNA